MQSIHTSITGMTAIFLAAAHLACEASDRRDRGTVGTAGITSIDPSTNPTSSTSASDLTTAAPASGAGTMSDDSTNATSPSGTVATVPDDSLSSGTSGTDEPATTGAASTTDETGQENCAFAEVEAEVIPSPVDIIIAIDNSGSMEQEIDAVRASLGKFAEQLTTANLDHHVVLLSTSTTGKGWYGICVDAPLGSGSCPNDSAEHLLHIDTKIDSYNALAQILSTHNQWAGFFRPEAAAHSLVVSDDNSSMTWNEFDTKFNTISPDYTFHAIVGSESFPCQTYANQGFEYIALQKLTAGELGNICASDFSTIFKAIADNVVETSVTPCAFKIPQQDDLDYSKVNVVISDLKNNEALLFRVDDEAQCKNIKGMGWYYDDNADPTQIHLCPEACSVVQGAKIRVQFGCKSIYPG